MCQLAFLKGSDEDDDIDVIWKKINEMIPWTIYVTIFKWFIWSKARKWVIQGACPLFSITILPFLWSKISKISNGPHPLPHIIFWTFPPDLIRTSRLSIFVILNLTTVEYTLFYKKVVYKKVVLDWQNLQKVLVLAQKVKKVWNDF